MTLKVNNNNLTQFKVANNTTLETLWVSDNELSVINVRSNTALKDLRMSNNADITALNLRSNISLEILYADGLSVSEINLVENTLLTMFSFEDNKLLTSIQVSSDFTMDSCLFRATGNSGHLSIVNTKGDKFYYLGQYLTEYGDAIVGQITNGGRNALLISTTQTTEDHSSARLWSLSYGDGKWGLPSPDQWKEIYPNVTQINVALSKVGANLDGVYWTSQYASTSASKSYYYIMDLSNGKTSTYQSSASLNARAVRDL